MKGSLEGMTTKARRIGPLYIRAITRRTLSTNGNPRFILHTSEGDWQTQTDAALGYSLENYTNSRFPDTYVIGDNVPAVTLLATPAGKVWGIELNGKVMH